jgi:aminopeptidase N
MILTSCRYIPFAKYQFADEEFHKFSKREIYTGNKDSDLRAYDVRVYDWTIKADPKKEKLSGLMRISFVAEKPLSNIMLDLQNGMKVKNVSTSSGDVDYKHKKDRLYIHFDDTLAEGARRSLEITYAGKPKKILNYGVVFWSEDKKGNPFISTLTQGIGPHFMMPCKDLLHDEPDTCKINIVTSPDLVGIGNGKLLGKTVSTDEITWHYEVSNPINIYNISFNIGDYTEIIFPYEDIQGVERQIQVNLLRQDSTRGRKFYAHTPFLMTELEGLYGPFPWWEDGCKILQTAVRGAAMEHQSAISMGNIFYNNWTPDSGLHANSTLVHELAHEWWGNSITASDYGDAWIHEGMASYAEALVAERLYGKEYYDLEILRNVGSQMNDRPVIKPFGVRYNSWVNDRDGNIYSKGALFMHTLRKQIDNDSLFFSTYKSATQKFDRSNISTDDLEKYFSHEVGRDMKPLFDMYLRKAAPPTLIYALDTLTNSFYFKWKEVPVKNFEIFIELKQGDQTTRLYPSSKVSEYKPQAQGELSISWLDFGYIELQKDRNLIKELNNSNE